jgi:F-type H+-transporting ATPase subunit b
MSRLAKTTLSLLVLLAPVLLAGVAVASEAAGAGEHGISPAKITDFIWRTVNFVVFAGILIFLVVKFKAKDFFARRAQDIAQTLSDLEARKAEVAQALAEAEARLAQVAAERDKIIQTFLAEGELEKAKILEKADQVAARIKEMAALTIEQETRKAVRDLKQEVVDLATQMAEDLLKKKVTAADQQGLVEEYLKKAVPAH